MYVENRGLNPYALDYPVCVEDAGTNAGRAKKHGRSQRTWLMNHILPSIFTTEADEHGNYKLSAEHNEKLNQIKKTIGLQPVDGYEPCADDYMTSWLNQASVKAALHVKDDIAWLDCSRTIRYKQADGHHDMTPIYKYLIDGKFGLNIVVYSGDNDDVCATSGTQSWIWDLGYKVAGKEWQAYTVNGQVGGYLTKWTDTKFAFATVHGAGHEVPTYKPDVAMYLWDSYLKGELTDK
jgi:carboxypeptidase C (cathepsin A)